MSISLSIDWPDGRSEEIPLASQRGARAWAEDARTLGLEWIPHFASFLPIDRDNIDQLLADRLHPRHRLRVDLVGYAGCHSTAWLHGGAPSRDAVAVGGGAVLGGVRNHGGFYGSFRPQDLDRPRTIPLGLFRKMHGLRL